MLEKESLTWWELGFNKFLFCIVGRIRCSAGRAVHERRLNKYIVRREENTARGKRKGASYLSSENCFLGSVWGLLVDIYEGLYKEEKEAGVCIYALLLLLLWIVSPGLYSGCNKKSEREREVLKHGAHLREGEQKKNMLAKKQKFHHYFVSPTVLPSVNFMH